MKEFKKLLEDTLRTSKKLQEEVNKLEATSSH
jgi:hypothetical protein